MLFGFLLITNRWLVFFFVCFFLSCFTTSRHSLRMELEGKVLVNWKALCGAQLQRAGGGQVWLAAHLSHVWGCTATTRCCCCCCWKALRAGQQNTTSPLTGMRETRVTEGSADHVWIKKRTPLRAGSRARTGSSCSGSRAGCWWCGCSSGPGCAHRARRSGPNTRGNHPDSGEAAAARLPSFQKGK